LAGLNFGDQVSVVLDYTYGFGKCSLWYEHYSHSVVDQTVRNVNRKIVFLRIQLFDLNLVLMDSVVGFLAT
jgi:hypothetical protein